MLNIPIYRAELDSDQLVFASAQELERALTWIEDRDYVIGLPNHNGQMMVEWKDMDGNEHVSVSYYKKETLSIHFPDMLASDSDRLLPNGEKDLRIFASLSEDGKGGDMSNGFTFTFNGNGTIIYDGFLINEAHESFENFKIIGIQQ